MLNFQKLVYEAINGSAAFRDFYNNSSEISKTRQAIRENYSIDFPPADPFFALIEAAYVRTTADKLINYVKFWPVVDFVMFVLEKEKKSGTDILLRGSPEPIDKTNMDSYDTLFTDNFNKRVLGTHPFRSYVPLSGKANVLYTVISKQISSQIIGQLALANFDTKSIKEAFYGLLNAHKKIRMFGLNDANPFEDNFFIDDLIINYKKYAGGNVEIPAKLKLLYDNVHAESIYSIAIAINTFFESEKNSLISPYRDMLIKNVNNKIGDFILNRPINTLTKLFEYDCVLESKANPTLQQAKKIPKSNLVGGYTIKNIKTIDSKPAKDLIQALETFGDYIKEGEPMVDKLSRIGSLAKGLSMGALTMGT